MTLNSGANILPAVQYLRDFAFETMTSNQYNSVYLQPDDGTTTGPFYHQFADLSQISRLNKMPANANFMLSDIGIGVTLEPSNMCYDQNPAEFNITPGVGYRLITGRGNRKSQSLLLIFTSQGLHH